MNARNSVFEGTKVQGNPARRRFKRAGVGFNLLLLLLFGLGVPRLCAQEEIPDPPPLPVTPKVASGLDFYWFLNEKAASELPPEIADVQFGMLNFNLFEMADLSERWESWEKPSNSVLEDATNYRLFPISKHLER